jgi:predicted esterase
VRRLAIPIVIAIALLAVAAPTTADDDRFGEIVERLLALPYDSAYQPVGTDDAFGPSDYPAAFPTTDTTTGDCCVGPVPDQPPLADLAPPFAEFPEGFELIELASYDGTPLHAFYADGEPGAPGIVVAHGFNTNGKWSIVRYAAFLHANGFTVIAPDHRDMGREWERGGSWHPSGERRGQSIGWKESEDFLVAAEELRDRGVERIGMVGFSEGAQNTILALAKDYDDLIDAAMTFSAPADQATLYQRNEAALRALLTTVVNNPDMCDYLGTVGEREEFSATPNFILRQDSAVAALDGRIGTGPRVPAIHFFAVDDELVPDWNATVLASRTLEMTDQETVLVQAGNHAYFYDRWWTQAAMLEWFRFWLGEDGTTAEPTVAQPPLGRPLAEQIVDLSGTTREDGDAELRPGDICEPVDEPMGPTALLLVDGDGAEWALDGRRSYSGWDDHGVASWALDLGDGTVLSGADILDAHRHHTYLENGTYEALLTVTDTAGGTATVAQSIEVSGAETDAGTDTEAPGDLPATGTSLPAAAALALLALAAAAAAREPQRN